MNTIDALMETVAMSYLADVAAYVPGDQAIVEVGTYQGANLVEMAKGAHSGLGAGVYGVDSYGTGDIYRNRPNMLKRYTHADLDIAREHIRTSGVQADIIVATSVQAAADWDGPEIGLLVIDGEHRFDPVLADFRAWKPHLAPDATVAFDDYGGRVGSQVIRAVDTLLESGELRLIDVVGTRLAVCR